MKLADVRKENLSDVLRFIEESVEHGLDQLPDFKDLTQFEKGVFATFKWMKQQISIVEIYAGVSDLEVQHD